MSEGVDSIGVGRRDKMVDKAINPEVVIGIELSDVAIRVEVVNKEVAGIGMGKEDRAEDETETVEAVAITELSDIPTRDGVGEMNEEVDCIEAEKEDKMEFS